MTNHCAGGVNAFISGAYAMVSSMFGQFGDQVMLLSPLATFPRGTELSFYYHMRISNADKTAALTVFTYSELHVLERRLLEIRGNHGTSWQRAEVGLPEGTYQLAFVATHGLQFLSDIALDEIEIDVEQPRSEDNNDKSRGKYLTRITNNVPDESEKSGPYV